MTPPSNHNSQKPEQLNLFEIPPSETPTLDNQEEPEGFPDFDLDALSAEELGLAEKSDRTLTIQTELLTLKLLKEAISKTNPDDSVMADFGDLVLPKLLEYTIGVPAKGGWFFEKMDREVAQGKRKPIRRDNAGDQSLNTHILNGLFPANAIERRLQTLNTNARRLIQDQERRLALAGFVLHDFEKFDYKRIPNSPEYLIKYSRDLDFNLRQIFSNTQDDAELAQNFTSNLDANRQLFDHLVPALNLDQFICPDYPENWQKYRDDLLYIAYNAQRKYDTNLNLGMGGLNPGLDDDRTLNCLADLACLADRLASIVKHPQDAKSNSLKALLHTLSDGQLQLTYHSITENRGVLTNIVNNAVMDAYTELNTTTETHYQPLLYLPTGVIYLATRTPPLLDRTGLPSRVVQTIKNLCAGELRRKQTGFGRDGKGMKYADYYSQFFDDQGLMEVALDATLRILNPTKKSVAKSRSENLIAFQQKGVLPTDLAFDFEDDIRIDQIAEFGDVATRKIWGDRRNKIEADLKTKLTGKAVKAAILALPDPNLIQHIATHWGLAPYLPQIQAIQSINETLKALKLKGNTGGVPYEWYYLAAQLLKKYPGQDSNQIRDRLMEMIAVIIKVTDPILADHQLPDGWDDLRHWTDRVVILPGEVNEGLTQERLDIFKKELNAYKQAKKPGRGRQLICSISHSPDTVSEQMESAVLFTPQVYTNKQMLGGANAKRNISSIASTEIMLRQILMSPTQAVGKKFEDGKYRYLYFYPTYYFTPETNNFLAKAYANIAQTRFDTNLRKHFVTETSLKAHLDLANYQHIDTFLIDEDLSLKTQLPEGDSERKLDYSFKLSYPQDKPLTFYFIALPPGRDPTDTESWVMPAWLGLIAPYILDVKTVVSESPIPPFREGNEFEETVFLDSAPQAFRVLLGRDRFRLHHLIEGWQDEGDRAYPAPLHSLTAAYIIHLNINPKRKKTGYDANWGKFTELASDLSSNPLTVFQALARWSRTRDSDVASIQRIQLYAYDLYPCFDPYIHSDRLQELLTVTNPKSPLNHPQKLVELYRKFYRAKKRYNPKANAVLKPIDVAAQTLLNAETSVFHGEMLVAVVAAEIFKVMDRVRSSTAEGHWKIHDREQERQAVLEFARYFVKEVFIKAFKGDRARLAGKQLNLIKDTCEFLYRLEQDKENQQYKQEKAAQEEE